MMRLVARSLIAVFLLGGSAMAADHAPKAKHHTHKKVKKARMKHVHHHHHVKANAK